jgi:tape measure domain-containing protein
MVIRELLTIWGFDVNDAPIRQADIAMQGALRTAGMMAAVVGGTVLAMGKFVKISTDMEQTEVAFETMLGSAEKSKAMLADLADFAAKTPFQLVGIQQQAKQLMAMGIPAEEVRDTLKMLGDVAAGTNVPLWRLSINLGQVKSMGKATSRELRDFAFAGVPIYDEMAKVLDVPVAKVREMATAGQITYPIVKKAFENMTSAGGKFANLMFKQSATLGGMWSNFIDNLQIMSIKIGKPLLAPLKKVITQINMWFEQNQKFIVEKLSKAMMSLLDLYIKVAGVIWRIAKRIGYLIEAFGGLGSVIKGVLYVLSALFVFFTSTAIYNHTKAVYGMARAFFTAEKSILGVNKAMALMYMKIAIAFLILEDLYQFANGGDSLLGLFLESLLGKEGFEIIQRRLSLGLEFLKGLFTGFFGGIYEALMGAWITIKDVLRQIDIQLPGGINAVLEMLFGTGELNEAELANLKQQMADIGKFIGEWVAMFITSGLAFISIVHSIISVVKDIYNAKTFEGALRAFLGDDSKIVGWIRRMKELWTVGRRILGMIDGEDAETIFSYDEQIAYEDAQKRLDKARAAKRAVVPFFQQTQFDSKVLGQTLSNALSVGSGADANGVPSFITNGNAISKGTLIQGGINMEFNDVGSKDPIELGKEMQNQFLNEIDKANKSLVPWESE